MTSSELIPPKSRRLDAGSVALAVATLVAIGGLAFAAGRLTAPAAASTGGFRNATGGTAAGESGGAAAGGLGTTGGTGSTGQAPTTSFAPGAGGFRGGFGGAAFGTGGGLTVSGTVTAVSSSSITLKLASGTTIDIPIDSSTTYHSQAPATAADVKVGGQVDVELASGGGTRDFTGSPAASPAAGAGNAANGSGPTASGAPASPNPGDFLSRVGPAHSITLVGP